MNRRIDPGGDRSPSEPEARRILVAGGGVAALEAVLTLKELARSRIEIVLLSPSPRFEYAPLSVAEPFELGRAHRFDLGDMLGDRGVDVVIDALESVEPAERLVRTTGGRAISYDVLLVATGGRKRSTVPGAVSFSGSRRSADVKSILREAGSGAVGRIVFAVPGGVAWSLPAYELALMTTGHLAEHRVSAGVELVSPESRPVEAFGARSSAAVAKILRQRGIAFQSDVPVRVEADRLLVERGRPIPADAVVALPAIAGPEIPGLPHDDLGFVPVDIHCRIDGVPGTYAAGDLTDFPLKQGGIATQQADAAAEAILADLGEDIRPGPFRPVLRGLLLTGRIPRHLRAGIAPERTTGSTSAEEAIWWPPAKIAGRRLGPFLALQGVSGAPPPGTTALALERSLDEGGAGSGTGAGS